MAALVLAWIFTRYHVSKNKEPISDERGSFAEVGIVWQNPPRAISGLYLWLKINQLAEPVFADCPAKINGG